MIDMSTVSRLIGGAFLAAAFLMMFARRKG
jgi:hypothetical protein